MGITIKALIDAEGHLVPDEPLAIRGPQRVVIEIKSPEECAELDVDTPTQPSPSSFRPFVGSRRYRLVKELGRGGMSVTYQAEDTNTGLAVCIKQLQAHVNRRSLQQECRALVKLDHPHIVRLIDFDTMCDVPYLVMEFVAGTPLNEWMREGRPMSESDACALMGQIADALAYAHSREVIHRDLKPGNIMLSPNGATPKIVDFGLAIVDRRDERDADTAIRSFAGTPHYMTPEQFRGRRLSGACDVYAMGQILWELLKRRPAFVGSNPFEIFAQKDARPGGLDFGDPAGIHESLIHLIAWCTRGDSEARPTAAQLSIELSNAVSTLRREASGSRKRWWWFGRRDSTQ